MRTRTVCGKSTSLQRENRVCSTKKNHHNTHDVTKSLKRDRNSRSELVQVSAEGLVIDIVFEHLARDLPELGRVLHVGRVAADARERRL